MSVTPRTLRQQIQARQEADYWRYQEFERAKEQKELAGVYEDECTWLGETLNGSMRTSFTYKNVNGELVASDGRAIGKIFSDGLQYSYILAEKDPRFAGEVTRCHHEWEEFQLMQWMANDSSAPNTMIVNSAILESLKNSTQNDVGGYKPARGMGWNRIITRNTDNSITITSQSLDGNSRAGYAAILNEFDGIDVPGEDELSNDDMLSWRVRLNLTTEEQQDLSDRLMAVYDKSMGEDGKTYRAGRLQENGDTWQFTIAQDDLVREHLRQAAPLILRYKRGDGSVEKELSQVRFATAATLKRRYELGVEWQSKHTSLAAERQSAASDAAASGESFGGCGLSVSVSAEQQLGELGFGNRLKRGACPHCKEVITYDVCDPSCSECGATKDHGPTRKPKGAAQKPMRGKRPKQPASRRLQQRRSQAPRQSSNYARRYTIGGAELIPTEG